MSKNQYWQFQNASSKKKSVDINIFGEIGEGGWFSDATSAKGFDKELKQHGDLDVINLYINSPGGSVFEASAIYNILKNHKAKVVAYIMGLAASAASYISMAADEVIMPTNSIMMVHKPLIGRAGGNATDFRKLANTLDTIEESLVAAYREKTGLSEEKIKTMLEDETWLTASEAKLLGFCDIVDRELQVAASIQDNVFNSNGQKFDLSIYKNIPDSKILNLQDIEDSQSNENGIINKELLMAKDNTFADKFINGIKSIFSKEDIKDFVTALNESETEETNGTETTTNETTNEGSEHDVNSASTTDEGNSGEGEATSASEAETESTVETKTEDTAETTEDAKKDEEMPMKKKKGTKCEDETDTTDETVETENSSNLDVENNAIVAMNAKIEALQGQVSSLTKEKEEAEALNKFNAFKDGLGKKFVNLVGKEEDIVNFLYNVTNSELSQEAKDFIFTNLENKSIENSKLTEEIGTSEAATLTVVDEFEKQAESLSKTKNITVQKAKAEIIEKNPELHQRLLSEQREQGKV